MTEGVAEQDSKRIYISRINRVIDYIKFNLDGDLSLEQLAPVAYFSKFYFHRIVISVPKFSLGNR